MFTGPVPTTHVHIYNLDTDAWTTTYMDQAGETLKMASIFVCLMSNLFVVHLKPIKLSILLTAQSKLLIIPDRCSLYSPDFVAR